MSTRASVQVEKEMGYRYWAFISYSHADRRWGDWLHRALESYRVPKHLVGNPGLFGTTPRRLYPVFRDREELSVSSDLGRNIQLALRQSRYLIVICSPRSARSHWVSAEIHYFKDLGREDRVFALIVAGEPNATGSDGAVEPDQECFPDALRFKLGSDGKLSEVRTEPIAGDARTGKDGKLNAKLKLIAGLIGVEYDALKRRDQERRRRYLMAATAVASIIALGMTALAIVAFAEAREAKRQALAANIARDQADGLINFMLIDLRDKLQQIGHLNVLGDVAEKAKAYLDGLPNEQMTLARRHQRAMMLSNLGDVLQARGKLPEALDAFRQGLKINETLADENRSDINARGDLSASYNKLGDALWEKGSQQEALEAYQKGLKINQRLAGDDKSNTGWQYKLSVSYERMGDVLEARGNLQEALDSYKQSLEIRRTLAARDETNTTWQRNLGVSYNRIGDILWYQGKLQEALDAYQQSLAIIKRLAAQDRSNTGWQYDLSVGYERIGDGFQAQGKLQPALDAFEESLNIRQALAAQDQSNTFWQRNLSIDYENVGDALKAQGKLPEALNAYREALSIFQRLAQQDKSNAGWQNDLAWSYNKVGDVLLAESNLPDALDAYQRGLAIGKALAQQDKSNTDWQHDLAVSHEKIGDVLRAQGDLTAAVENYRLSLDIRRALAEKDKSNTDWQHDLIVSLWKLGATTAAIGNENVPAATALLREAMSITEAYQGSDRLALLDTLNRALQSLPAVNKP